MCMGLLEWSGDRALRHAATAALFLIVFKGFSMSVSSARFFRSAAFLALVAVSAIHASSVSAGNWTGYMNVFNNASGTQGSYVFGNGWGVADLKTTVSNSNSGTIVGDQLVLEPNYNTYTNYN